MKNVKVVLETDEVNYPTLVFFSFLINRLVLILIGEETVC